MSEYASSGLARIESRSASGPMVFAWHEHFVRPAKAHFLKHLRQRAALEGLFARKHLVQNAP
jgi:hypothetical protein